MYSRYTPGSHKEPFANHLQPVHGQFVMPFFPPMYALNHHMTILPVFQDRFSHSKRLVVTVLSCLPRTMHICSSSVILHGDDKSVSINKSFLASQGGKSARRRRIRSSPSCPEKNSSLSTRVMNNKLAKL